MLLVQDERSSASKSNQLEGEIIELIERLEQYPKIGRRADFYSVTPDASQDWLQTVEQLAAQARMPEFRECVLSPYVPVRAFR